MLQKQVSSYCQDILLPLIDMLTFILDADWAQLLRDAKLKF